MTPAGSVSLDLPADIGYLHIPLACLAAFLEGSQDLAVPSPIQGETSADAVYGLKLAVYEVCANIVQHAYGIHETADEEAERGRLRIVFTLERQRSRLEIDLHDRGCAFDPATISTPDPADPQTGGYGLYLVRQLVDEVTYEAGPTGNHWRLIKQFSRVAGL